MTSSISNDVTFFFLTLKYVLINLIIKFCGKGFVRSRDIDVLVSTESRFFKAEMDTHTKILLDSDNHADYKNIFCFTDRNKIEKFGENMQILQISVRFYEYQISCNFKQKLYSNDPY